MPSNAVGAAYGAFAFLPGARLLFRCRRRLALPLLIVVLFAGAVTAQPLDTSSPARQSAPVVLANRTIIVLRGPIVGYSAQERVEAVDQRLESILAAESTPSASIKDADGATQVLLDGKLVFTVTGIDIDPGSGETTQLAAREAAKRLDRAVVEFREQHTPRYMVLKAGLAALATGVLAAVLWLIVVVDRWAGRRLAGAAADRANKLNMQGVNLLDPGHIRLIARRLFAAVAWAIGAFAVYSWLTFVLVQFPYTRAWGEGMEGNLLNTAGQTGVAVLRSIPGLLVVIVIILLTRAFGRMTGFFFRRIERGDLVLGALDAETVAPTRRIFNLILWAFALAIAFPFLPGSDTEAFKGISVLLGLMISIGGSSLVGQAVSGLILMYTRAFRIGEFVRIGDTTGTIVEVGAFATRLRTGMGEEVLLPNAHALQNTTRNFSREMTGPGFVIHVPVTISYTAPWRQVHAMLEEAARRTSGVATDPAPYVRQTALSDFFVEYRLVAQGATDDPAQRVDLVSRLNASIQDVFNEYDVPIMSPHYLGDPAEPQVVPKAHWYAPPAKPDSA